MKVLFDGPEIRGLLGEGGAIPARETTVAHADERTAKGADPYPGSKTRPRFPRPTFAIGQLWG